MSHPSFVLDTSVAVASVLPYERWHVEADRLMQSLLTTPAIAPGVWIFEVSGSLLRIMRDGKITQFEAESALNSLFQVPVLAVSDDYRGVVLKEVWRLARDTGLKLNDASFLHLALVLDVPLATFDTQLRRAAVSRGVALLPGVL